MSILIEDVSKRLGAQAVLDRVSLEVAPGELFVLLGASGSGKSTMLRILAGLSSPDRGRIAFFGRDVTSLRPQKRGTGFVFQNYSVFQHMTVGENIEFGLKLRHVPRAARAKRRDELLEQVGLPGFANRHAALLSGGQQQRVAIARALAYEPKVLLLDEPFGALDVKIRTQLRRSLREIHDRLHITTLLVTHDQDEAFELADRIGLMDRGRLIEVGRPEELYARPRTLFAATFLGSGTVLVGQVEKGLARFPGLDLAIKPSKPHDEGAQVHLLVRPEDLLVTAQPSSNGSPSLGAGVVVEESFAGALRRVRIRLPVRPEVHQASSPPSDADGLVVDALIASPDPLPGRDVWVALRRWHVLDPPAPSLLVADDGREPMRMLEVARYLARRLSARITVLGVAGDAREADALGRRITRRLKRAEIGDAEYRVRFGNVATQILNEQSDVLSQMILLAPRRDPFASLGRFRPPHERRQRLGRTIASLIATSRVPVLIVSGPRRGLQHMTVVSTGRAGVADLHRVSARLAAALDLSVTLIGAEPKLDRHPEKTPPPHDPFEKLRVPVTSRLHIHTLAIENVCTEVLQVASDLMVVSVLRHGPHAVNEVAPLAAELLARSDRPVLVVPTSRGAPTT